MYIELKTISGSNPTVIDLRRAAKCFCLSCGKKIKIKDPLRGILLPCRTFAECSLGKQAGVKIEWSNGIIQFTSFITSELKAKVKRDTLEMDSVEMLRES